MCKKKNRSINNEKTNHIYHIHPISSYTGLKKPEKFTEKHDQEEDSNIFNKKKKQFKEKFSCNTATSPVKL